MLPVVSVAQQPGSELRNIRKGALDCLLTVCPAKAGSTRAWLQAVNTESVCLRQSFIPLVTTG